MKNCSQIKKLHTMAVILFILYFVELLDVFPKKTDKDFKYHGL